MKASWHQPPELLLNFKHLNWTHPATEKRNTPVGCWSPAKVCSYAPTRSLYKNYRAIGCWSASAKDEVPRASRPPLSLQDCPDERI